tara:strand:- start:80 stop:187 length:108 start_codon:yes stop_codon:yes gene_type:complete
MRELVEELSAAMILGKYVLKSKRFRSKMLGFSGKF